jgi:survival-of-motor-neuron-related-splicing factor 30
MKRSDTDKVKLQKKKKVKALKYQHKVKLQEIESKVRQNTWLDFANKATSQKAGHFATKNESIFKSPDTIMGKVGVVGSGKQMTSYESNKIKLN